MKKFLCLFLGLILVMTVFAGCNIIPEDNADSNNDATLENTESRTDTNPQDTESENVLVENPATDFEYEINDAGYVFITKYIGSSKSVVIPSEIEGREVVSLKGFQDTPIETVVLPVTIRVIGAGAFESCTALTTVIIPPDSQLLAIQLGAFDGCSALKSIGIDNAENLKTIEMTAFRNCISIEKIKFPSNLETIGKYAFENCSALRSVNIPAKLELRYGDASRFYKVPALEEIIFDEGRESITGYVFFSITSTVNVIIPESVTNIDMLMFGNAGTLNLYFSGDYPQITNADMSGNVTVHYDPSTNGWDTIPLSEFHIMIPS